MDNALLMAIFSGIGTAVMMTIKELVMWKVNRISGKKQEMWESIEKLSTDMTIFKRTQMVFMRDRVQSLSKQAIQAGCISVEEREAIIDIYDGYKQLNGNGQLDDLVTMVKQLKVQ